VQAVLPSPTRTDTPALLPRTPLRPQASQPWEAPS